MNILILFSLVMYSLVSAFPKGKRENTVSCGYVSCPSTNRDSDVLNVHLVPHSHDDVGWLKTIDQYYYGSHNNIQKAGVQYILDSVVQALLQNSKRRFVYVETAFFWKWWLEKEESIREQVRYLVNNGQLEIVGGAWSMNDEAAAHYQSIIDQFTWGFRKLDEALGSCARPKIAWQIDPFGHSREMASLSSQFGFDGLFFARLDWRDKNQRLRNKSAEMLWQASSSLGSSSQIFTSVLYNHYSAPTGFCFDVLCNDSPIVDNKDSPEYNANSKAKMFVNFVETQASYYKTNNVIVTMGDDFNYQDAMSYFTNLDKLITAVTELNKNVSVFYSSPSCYVKAINEANQKFPIKNDDFFPYASDPHTYWSGYFTSRPTSKRFERLSNNFLQVAKQLSALSIPEDSVNNLDPLREAIGVMQHHDAITGTEKQNVADDYHRILTDAFNTSETAAESSLRKLYQQTQEIKFHSCLLLNISQCKWTEEQDKVFLTVYNPLSRSLSHYVRIPVTEGTYIVYHDGNVVQSQLVPILEKILKVPGRKSSATHELIFRAESIAPLGFKLFQVKRLSTIEINKIERLPENPIKLYFDKFGKLKLLSISDKEISIAQNFLYYPGAAGNNAEFKNRSSGAYIFRPFPGIRDAISVSKSADLEKFDGPLVTEYHQKFNKWISQVIRVYNKENYIEFNWVVGPIPIDDQIGKEIITRFTTDLNTKEIFYTDSNGREMIQRVRGERSTFNLTHEEPVAENYYPVTAKITIKDEETKQQISVLNDRAQGGTSIKDGEIELMIHRRLIRDDAFGVGEALNENAFGTGLVATGKHYLVIGENTEEKSAAVLEKDLASRILLEPWIFISVDNVVTSNKPEFNGLKASLPKNIQILTLEPWNKNKILLRLEHIFEKDEDPILSVPVTVDIKDLFTTFKVLEVKEMALGANQLLSEVEKLKWKSEMPEYKSTKMEETEVTLNPMEIKTFILKIQSILF